MAKKIKISLSQKSIQNAIKEIEKYQKSLIDKTEIFANRLADLGISTARENSKGVKGTLGTHKMENYVTFSKMLNKTQYGCVGMMIGSGKTFYTQWITDANGSTQNGEINALLALEFGTAGMALDRQKLFGVTAGRGTNSVSNHENDTVWWIAEELDADGKPIWKKASAITPTRPMHHAVIEMQSQINKIANEVFRS